jgi:predicted Zn-dependent protease
MTTKTARIVGTCLVGLAIAVPAHAQLGGLGRIVDKAKEGKEALDKGMKTWDDLTITPEEERQMGSEISTRLRNKYGVVQDRAVHRYVTLVGSALAQESSRASLRWTFVVLDTDGVNAFAAPGGFVHVTKGALALIKNEAELADVLGHEIAHVSEQHTIKAIKKSKWVSTGATVTRSQVLAEATERAYAAVLENSFDRGDEIAADRIGITLANKVGYAPQGLAAFLTRLADRNKDLKERSGMFASHPEAKARLDDLARTISGAKLTAAALVAPRYGQSITFTSVPVTAVKQAAAAPAAGSKPESGGGRMGMSNLTSLGRDRSSNDTVSSAGSRGVNPDRDAAGGPVKALVAVTVSAAEIATFRKGIS